MDFDLSSIASGIFIGAVGMLLFMRGKREADLKCLGMGLVMCIYPYFVASLLLTWGIFGLCLGGLYVMAKNDTSTF